MGGKWRISAKRRRRTLLGVTKGEKLVSPFYGPHEKMEKLNLVAPEKKDLSSKEAKYRGE